MFIAEASREAGRTGSSQHTWLHGTLIAGIILALVAQVWVVFNHMFSADEFHYLGQVHDYLRGSLDLPLQTLHVHLFAPLAALPGTEVEQLIAGRMVMLVFECVSLVSLYLLARTWAGKGASLTAVLAFATMPLTLQHGASFRTDPLALALVMTGLAVLARAPLRGPQLGAIGLLAGIAFLVTMKVIFFVPAFAGIAAWRLVRSTNPGRTAVMIAVVPAVALFASISIYLLHKSGLPAAAAAEPGALLANAGSVTIVTAGIFPAAKFLLLAAATAPLQVLLIVGTTIALLIRLFAASRRARWQTLALLGCIGPLACLFFYRNAFPYFIPTISAPAFAATAWFIQRRNWNALMLTISAAAMVAGGAIFLASGILVRQAEQRATFRAVHQIFPEPVTYIDGSSMLASFPRQGFFMSGWGMSEYRKRPPIFEDMLRERQIPLLLLNSSAFERALGLGISRNGRLLPEDARVLRENYIPHWGPVWVAGKQVRLDSGRAEITILIPGTYTVEGTSVSINGRELRPGDTVMLSRGTFTVAGEPGSVLILRWGKQLARPDTPPPEFLSRGF